MQSFLIEKVSLSTGPDVLVKKSPFSYTRTLGPFEWKHKRWMKHSRVFPKNIRNGTGTALISQSNKNVIYPLNIVRQLRFIGECKYEIGKRLNPNNLLLLQSSED